MKKTAAGLALAFALVSPVARAEVDELRIPRGAGGVGFLPLLEMQKHGLIQKHAKAQGLTNLTVKWVDVGGPAQVNDALLSGAAHVAPSGPPGFLLIWDRTRSSIKVTGLAAMTSMPMYLNTKAPEIKSIDDVGPKDKIAVTAVKASIPATIMQIYARKKFGADQTFRFDPMTVTMTHPDGLAALLSGAAEIKLHYTSPPFHQRERRDPAVHTIQTTTDVMGSSTTFTMIYMTAKFHDENPKTVAAFLAALEEANTIINFDKSAAADVFLESVGRKGWSHAEIEEVLKDPEIKFTTTPENYMKYAEFMHAIGSIKTKPASWKDVFFPEIHGKPGT
ncbi:MAG: ABC transporter substrate-binding protein [Proteobacteria bacterium]|nr:ABC transporter substrate-binding protein [Pseudomonadota bacterium]